MPLQVENLILDVLTADPVSPVEGQLWFNSTAGELRAYRGGQTRSVDSKRNTITNSNPTSANDSTQGYEVGSRWLNSTSSVEYICTSNAVGAAVWSSLNSVAIPSYFETNAAGDVTTTSITDVLVTGMTLTPGAGTYIVMYRSDWSGSTNSVNMFASVYANGTLVANSTAQYIRGNQVQRNSVQLQSIATVAAGQSIETRWRVSTGTGTMGNRSLLLIKVG